MIEGVLFLLDVNCDWLYSGSEQQLIAIGMKLW